MFQLNKDKFFGRDFISLSDFTAEEIHHMIDVALGLKNEKKTGVAHPLLPGKTLAMIFTKSSTRTRVSFEVGIYQLGGSALLDRKSVV